MIFSAYHNAIILIYNLSGKTSTSLSNAAIRVCLQALIIYQRHLFWANFRDFKISLNSSNPSPLKPYIYNLYIIMGRITALYNNFDLLIKGPQVEAIILISKLQVIATFLTIFLTCSFYISFRSIQTLNTLRDFFFISTSLILNQIIKIRSPIRSYLCFIKCIKVYFLGENRDLYLINYVMHRLCASVSL